MWGYFSSQIGEYTAKKKCAKTVKNNTPSCKHRILVSEYDHDPSTKCQTAGHKGDLPNRAQLPSQIDETI